ncbi:MAG: His/Gly/Thr/Pro-type tRNA ligase C-terminal domain-containing protein, partial [Chitinophagaceae bacterium]
EKVKTLMQQLKAAGISVKYDDNDNNRPGWKFAEYEMKGVPVRMAIGARDLENNTVELARRDTKEKMTVSIDGIAFYIKALLDEIQIHMFNKAKQFREERITRVDSWEDFVKTLDEKGGFVSAHWDGSADTEEKIKDLSKATIRCIPLNNEPETGACILTGNPSAERVLFARAY